MKEILIKLKEAYLNHVFKYKGKNGYKVTYRCVGLCFVATYNLSFEENELFQNYLNKCKKKRKVFYDYKGNKVEDDDQFLWIPQNVQVRLNWLDKQIVRLS